LILPIRRPPQVGCDELGSNAGWISSEPSTCSAFAARMPVTGLSARTGAGFAWSNQYVVIGVGRGWA
jgi:hypothetical protein